MEKEDCKETSKWKNFDDVSEIKEAKYHDEVERNSIKLHQSQEKR